jgi:hypothetical protein
MRMKDKIFLLMSGALEMNKFYFERPAGIWQCPAENAECDHGRL